MAPGLNVFPGDTVADVVDGGWVNPQHHRQFPPRQGTGFDQGDFADGEFCVESRLPYRESVAFHCLINVVCLSAGAQMGGLDTDGPVTRMQDVQFISKWPDKKSICSSVGFYFTSVDIEVAVSSAIYTACPVPASFGGGGRRRRIARHKPPECISLSETPWSGWFHIFSLREA